MADFMSRNPISSPAGQAETIDDAQVLFIEEELIDAQTIIAETKKDPVLSKVLQFTVNGWAEKVDDSLLQPDDDQPDWRWCWTPKRLEVQTTTFTTGFV